jgi:hypothetical protein
VEVHLKEHNTNALLWFTFTLTSVEPWAAISTGLPAVQRYGLALGSVALALGAALLVDSYSIRDVEVPLFLFAVAITTWYGRGGAAAMCLALSCLAFEVVPNDLGSLPRKSVFAWWSKAASGREGHAV